MKLKQELLMHVIREKMRIMFGIHIDRRLIEVIKVKSEDSYYGDSTLYTVTICFSFNHSEHNMWTRIDIEFMKYNHEKGGLYWNTGTLDNLYNRLIR